MSLFAVPVRFYSRRNKSLAQTAKAAPSALFDLNLDSPTFGQVPFDSPLLGPKPKAGYRKRRSPFWRVTPGSKFAQRHFTHDAELQSREKQRLAELRLRVQKATVDADVAALDAASTPPAVAAGAASFSAADSYLSVAATNLRKWSPPSAPARLPEADALALAREISAAERALADQADADADAAKAAKAAAKKDAKKDASAADTAAAPKKATAASKKKKDELELDDD